MLQTAVSLIIRMSVMYVVLILMVSVRPISTAVSRGQWGRQYLSLQMTFGSIGLSDRGSLRPSQLKTFWLERKSQACLPASCDSILQDCSLAFARSRRSPGEVTVTCSTSSYFESARLVRMSSVKNLALLQHKT